MHVSPLSSTTHGVPVRLPFDSMSNDPSSHSVEEALFTTAKQSVVVLVAQMAAMGLGFVEKALLARYMGAKVVGQYAIVLTLLNLTGVLTVFGMHEGAVKYIPQFHSRGDEEKLGFAISDLLVFGSLSSTLVALGLVGGRKIVARRFFDSPDLVVPIVIAGVTLVPYTLKNIVVAIFQGFKNAAEAKVFGRAGIKCSMVVSIALLAWLDRHSTSWVVGAFLWSNVLSVCILLVRSRSWPLSFTTIVDKLASFFERTEEERETRRAIMTFSATLILVEIVTRLLTRVDILILGIFVASSEVGIYQIAVLVSTLVALIPVAFNSIFPSFISELIERESYDELQSLYSTLTKWAIVLEAPVIASLVLFREPILAFFGPEYTVGAMALVFVALSEFSNVLIGLNGPILKLGGYERLVLVNNSILAGLNIVLNIVLIPEYGIEGAAIATLVSMVSIGIVKVVEVWYLFGIFPYHRGFLHLAISFVALGGFLHVSAPFVDGVLDVAIVTILNGLVAIGTASLFADDFDRQFYERVRDSIWGSES